MIRVCCQNIRIIMCQIQYFAYICRIDVHLSPRDVHFRQKNVDKI